MPFSSKNKETELLSTVDISHVYPTIFTMNASIRISNFYI